MYSLKGILSQVPATPPVGTIVVVVVIGVIALVAFLLIVKFARLWLQAYFSRADVRLSELIGMWLRKVDARTIVEITCDDTE